MKKHLFYTILGICASTAIVTLLGVLKAVPVEPDILNKLVWALLLESAAAVIGMFGRTDFFSEEEEKQLKDKEVVWKLKDEEHLKEIDLLKAHVKTAQGMFREASDERDRLLGAEAQKEKQYADDIRARDVALAKLSETAQKAGEKLWWAEKELQMVRDELFWDGGFIRRLKWKEKPHLLFAAIREVARPPEDVSESYRPVPDELLKAADEFYVTYAMADMKELIRVMHEYNDVVITGRRGETLRKIGMALSAAAERLQNSFMNIHIPSRKTAGRK